MAATTPLSPPAAHSTTPAPAAHLTGSLGPVAIIFMVVAAASPLTVLGGGAPLGIALGNGAGYPALFFLSMVVFLLFAVGLNAMARVVDKPGAFYTYVGYGIGRHAGVAAAWLALLCYTTVQVAVHAYMGFVLSETLASLGGPHLPWWIFSLLVIAFVGLLGYRHIDMSAKVLGVLLIGEVLITIAMVIAVVATGGADGLTLATFAPSEVLSGHMGVGLMFALAGFIGFESTAVYRDEARDPSRTIPRATYGALVLIGVFYTLGAWMLVMAWGPDSVMGEALANPGAFFLDTAYRYLGVTGLTIVNILLITSMFACVLSFHNVIARYQLSMAHTGLLPTNLKAVHITHASPHVSSVTQTATAAGLTVLFAVLGLDPMLHVFTWFSGVATLAILMLMVATGIAVLVYFARHRTGFTAWQIRIAPALGVLGLVACGWAVLSNFPLLVGDVDASGAPTFGIVSWLLAGSCVLFPAVGAIQAEVIRRRSAAAYDGILTRLTEEVDDDAPAVGRPEELSVDAYARATLDS